MTDLPPETLDVRELLRAGGEPFGKIMSTLARLAPGQGLRLLATFKPEPLFAVLARRGFSHAEREIGNGDWEVLFSPGAPAAPPPRPGPAAAAGEAASWPAPARSLDNRGLQPPEPMVRILEALAGMAPGEVLEAFNDREPVLLYPELAARRHAYCAERRDAGGVRLLVRCHAADLA